MLTGLSALEQEVVDAARRGVWAGGEGGPVAELAITEDPDLHVRADLIRELLLGRHGELDPLGVRIHRLRVVGQLYLDKVTAAACLALHQCALPDGVTCRRAWLPELFLDESLLSHLHASGLRTDGALFLRGVVVRGAGEGGAVRLLSAHIGGQVELDRAEITNETGPALLADGLRTDGTLFLRGVVVRGAGEGGAVRLHSAHIGGQVELDRAEITNETGPALNANWLRTDGALFLRGVVVRGAGEGGAVRLHSAHISGQVVVAETQVINPSGPLMDMDDMRVDGTLFLPATVVCPQAGTEVGRRDCPDVARRIEVRGLVFRRLGKVSWRQWLHLLVHHTPTHLPQPFQHLATVERAAGHDNNAREILITQQEDLRRRTPDALGGQTGRWRHRLWGWLGRYGYRAHRLVAALGLVLALAGGTAYAAGQVPTRPGHHAAERVAPTTPPATATSAVGTPCSTAELIGLGIDRGLPLGATGLRARCDLDTATRRGQAFTYALWLLQALLWALATLTIAAYTGLVRKPT